jgi:hypothetical protein
MRDSVLMFRSLLVDVVLCYIQQHITQITSAHLRCAVLYVALATDSYTQCKYAIRTQYITVLLYYTLLPMNSAPMSCSSGISSGKLNGATTATGPYGHLQPLLICGSSSVNQYRQYHYIQQV